MPTNGKEKTGYTTQRPLGLLERIVKVHSSPGGTLPDFFAGSGTFSEAAAKHHRSCLLVVNNPEAVRIMERRLDQFGAEVERVEASYVSSRRQQNSNIGR